MNLQNTLTLRNLTCFGFHGCSEEEREEPQAFGVTITLFADFETVLKTDDLKDTIDYRLVESIAIDIIGKQSKNLIETIAGLIADKVLRKTKAIIVSVTILRKETQTKSNPEITITKFKNTM